MTAYVIADLDVHDEAGYDAYRRQVGATIARYGGRFIVRGGAVTPYEGGWRPSRVVVVEFPDMKALDAWYRSPEYKPLLTMRLGAASGGVIGVEGL